MVYAPGDKMMWSETGSKNVELTGGEEKQAFMLLVSVANNGTVLPFQAVYHGKTERSVPHHSSPSYENAVAAGFRFEFTGTKTYWSNQKTMRDFVTHILAPYFAEAKAKAGRPASQ